MPFGVIGVFSVIGEILRSLSSNYPSLVMDPAVWAQAGGCLLIGYFSTQKDFLTAHYPQLVTGLNSGLCGSYTSFSAFIWVAYKYFGGEVSQGAGFDVYYRIINI